MAMAHILPEVGSLRQKGRVLGNVAKAVLVDPRLGFVQGLGEPTKHIINLRFSNDEGWTEGDGIAQRAYNKAVCLGIISTIDTNPLCRLKRPLGILISYEFEGGHETDASSFAHQWMVGKGLYMFLETRCNLTDVVYNIALFYQFDGPHRHRCRDGVPGVGKTVSEDTDLLTLLYHRVEDILGKQNRRDR